MYKHNLDRVLQRMYKHNFKRLKYKQNWRLSPSWQACLPLAAMIMLVWCYAAVAQNSPASLAEEVAQFKQEVQVGLDTMWVVFAACLVFFMNAGFAMLEAGFCRRKNTVNLLAKNLIVFALSTVAFWALGFALMFGFGGDWSNSAATDNGFIGIHGFFLSGEDNSPLTNNDYQGVFRSLSWAGVPLKAKFLFQLVFAGTAATIVSGAVAERIKFLAFILFSFVLVSICYPITGHWIWGGGWLQNLGFWDFAGSTVVHSVGGWAALVGAVLLKPRLGKYDGDESLPLPGHNLSISTLGCLILWLGWFGFNPGSTMAADPEAITHILLTTNLAAAAGTLAATFTSWWRFSKPDLTMTINGVLAGLVAITAPCSFVNLWAAVLIGLIAGIIVVFSVDFIDGWKIDDPVGAISVHLVCGVWGTFAVGLFAEGVGGTLYSEGPAKGLFMGGSLNQLLAQLLGIACVGAFTVGFSFLAWWGLKVLLGGIRVEPSTELKGLDLSEHGMPAYDDFVFNQEAPSALPDAD